VEGCRGRPSLQGPLRLAGFWWQHQALGVVEALPGVPTRPSTFSTAWLLGRDRIIMARQKAMDKGVGNWRRLQTRPT
jgi:hypothetical protein